MSAVANVAVNLDSRGVPAKLKQIADRGKEVDRSLNGAAAATTKAGREFKSAGNAASQAAGGFNKLVRGLAGAAAGFVTVGTAAALAGRAIQSAIGRTESERRLQILASSYGEVAQIQNVAAASAKLFGQSQTETNQSIATAYARLRPLGISLDEISSTYNGFNTAARLSGSTAQETSAAFTQLAQALGSGVLRGDEFNSIAEQAPGLLQAISRELNVAVGELRDYAKDGKITSDVVINALKAIESEGAAPLAEALSGPEQKLKDLQNETDNLNAEIGKLALPALIAVVGELTDVIRTASENTKVFSQVMNGLRQEFDFILTPLGSFYEYIGGIPGIMTTAIDSLFSMLGPLRQVAQLIGFISGETLGPALQRAQAIGSYTGMADAPEDVRRALNPPARPTIPTIPTGGGGGGKSRANRDAQRAADEAKRIQERINGLQQDVALNEKLRGIRERIAEADLAGDQALAAKLQGEERLLQLVDSYDRLKASAANNAEREALEAKLQSEALLVQQDVLNQLNKLDSDKAKALEGQLRPLQEQRRLLEAQLNGRREEEELIIQIENATRGLGDAEAQRVKQLIRGNAELEKQAKQPNLIRDLSAQVKQLQKELNPVKLATETITNGAFAIGDAFSQAFVDVISGAKSTEQALADTFESIGKAFLQMAAEIIAKQLAMIALQTILKALGAISSGFSFAGGSAEAGLDAANQMGGVAPLDAGMFGFRANGGPVTGGSPYIVGERGPELFVPQQSGAVVNNDQLSAAMGRYRRSSGDAGAMTAGGATEAGTAGAAVMDKPIDVRYTVERINNVEYVTADQFQSGMRQAALEGAKRGEQQTIRRLQTSASIRRKIGV